MERVQVNMLGGGEEIEEPLTVTEWGSDAGASVPQVKTIYLRNFCVFCLRRLRMGLRRTRGGTGLENEVGGVPRMDLKSEEKPKLIDTLNWMWEALRRKREEDNVPVERSELEKVQRFNGIPKCCERCGVKVLEVDNLFRKVREEVGQLRRLIGRWNEVQGRLAEFQGDLTVSGLAQEGIVETLWFVSEFHSELEKNSGGTERMNMRTDPLLLGDNEVAEVDNVLDEHVSSPHSGSQSQIVFEDEGDDSDYGDNGSDPDYIKSEEEDDSDDARISVYETKVLVPVPLSAPAENKELIEIKDVQVPHVKEDTAKDNPNDLDYSEDDNGSDNDSNFESPYDDEDEDYIPVAKKTRQSTRSQTESHPSCSSSSENALELENEVHNLPQKKKRGPRPKPKTPGPGTLKYKQKVTCDECGVTVTFGCFARHQRRCENARNNPKIYKSARLSCKICGKLVIANFMRKHMQIVHSVVSTEKLRYVDSSKVKQRCDFCKIRLPRAKLLGHLEGHVGSEYVLRCPNPDCLFMCITHHRLELHLRGKDSAGNDCVKKSVGSFKQYKSNLLTCGVCGVEQNNRLALRSHLLQLHEDLEKPFLCPISGCGMKFTLKQTLVLHLGHHDVPKQLETQPCPMCENKKKIKLEEMESHLQNDHEVQVVKCTQCPFSFPSTREELVEHMYQHRFGVLICDICGDSAGRFPRHSLLADHYFTVHQIGRKLVCEHCQRDFLRQESLFNHVKKEHGNTTKDNDDGLTLPSKPTFNCEECGITFKTIGGLKSHKIREHGGTPYACKYCSHTFRNETALSAHEREVHRGIEVQKEFPCPEPNCGKVYNTKQKLKHHHRSVHLGAKGDHVCDMCGKDFAKPQGLRIHMEAVHLGLRKYVCDCGEAFTSDTVLKRHRLIHTGERPHSCNVCHQRFRTKDVLQRHLEGHQRKGANFKPNGPMQKIRKRVQIKRKAEAE